MHLTGGIQTIYHIFDFLLRGPAVLYTNYKVKEEAFIINVLNRCTSMFNRTLIAGAT